MRNLKQLEHKLVRLEGRVAKFGHHNNDLVLLQSVKIWHWDGNQATKELDDIEPEVTIDHAWIELGGDGWELYSKHTCFGRIYLYERNDGSEDYGIKPLRLVNAFELAKFLRSDASKTSKVKAIDNELDWLAENDGACPVHDMCSADFLDWIRSERHILINSIEAEQKARAHAACPGRARKTRSISRICQRRAQHKAIGF